VTFYGLLRQHAASHATRVALTSAEAQLTYGELLDVVERVGAGLASYGVGPGRPVVSTLPKGCCLVVVALGTWLVGGVFAQVSASPGASWVRGALDLLEAQLVVGPPGVGDTIRSHGCDAPYVTMGRSDGDWEALYGAGVVRTPPGDGGSPAYVNFTSGTTGVPKGVVATEHNVLVNDGAAAYALDLSADDVHLCLFPAHLHPHEIFARGLLLGGTTVVAPTLHPRGVAGAVQRWGVTALMAAPFFYELATRGGQAKQLGGLRVAEAGGAVSSLHLRQALRREAGVELSPVWGSTETTGVALVTRRSGYPVHEPGFVGGPCPGYEGRVVDSELQLSGDGIGLGYLVGRGLALSSWGEWFPTGDCFADMRDGTYRFLGRKSGMIKVAGERVYPAELEEALSSHPDVVECAVIGVPDSLRGEVPAAALVTRRAVGPRALIDHCRAALGARPVPRRWIFVAELPRGPGGKVDPLRVRQLFDS
jgi:acyl-coenzyme A synthetase/AMP-(fatty) acid ligase